MRNYCCRRLTPLFSVYRSKLVYTVCIRAINQPGAPPPAQPAMTHHPQHSSAPRGRQASGQANDRWRLCFLQMPGSRNPTHQTATYQSYGTHYHRISRKYLRIEELKDAPAITCTADYLRAAKALHNRQCLCLPGSK